MGEFEDDPDRDDNSIFSSLGIGEGVDHDGNYGLVRKKLRFNQYFGRPAAGGGKHVISRAHVDQIPASCKYLIL